MKSRVITVAVLIVFLAAGVFGIVKRQTYTDITSESNYLDNLNVALIREKSVLSCCDLLYKEIKKLPIVLKVECVEEREYVFSAGHQKVRVKEIFKGKELVKEEEVYLYSGRWGFVFDTQPISAQVCYQELMQPGEEYLVCLTGNTVKIYGEDAIAYEVYGDLLLQPIFLYGEREHVPVELSESADNTYVPYLNVKGNEMFSDTVAGYKAWLELKEKLFEIYG